MDYDALTIGIHGGATMLERRLSLLEERALVVSLCELETMAVPTQIVVAHCDYPHPDEYWALFSDSAQLRASETGEWFYEDALLIREFVGVNVSEQELRKRFGCAVIHLWVGMDE